MAKNEVQLKIFGNEALFLRWWLEAMTVAGWLWRTRKTPAFLDQVQRFMKEAEVVKNELIELHRLEALHEKWRNNEITTAEYQLQTVLIWESAEQVRRTAGVV